MPPSAAVNRLFDELQAMELSGGRHPDSGFVDHRTRAIAVIGAAVCMSAPVSTFKALVNSAVEAGATDQDVVGALLAVASIAGEARVVQAASRISLALGYDIDRALETE